MVHQPRGRQLVKHNSFRNAIAEYKMQSGRTQAEIAEILGLSQSSISHYMTGNRYPSENTMKNLDRLMNSSIKFSDQPKPRKANKANREIIATRVCESCCKHLDDFKKSGVNIMDKCRECPLNKLI